MNRRDFLKFVGVASSATVLSSCGVEKGTEKIIPMLVPPEDPNYLPGEALYRNSTCTECPAGCGMSVKIVDFNPIKLEGIENHPLNDGALCLRGQSSLMRLYHPERVKTPLKPKKEGLILDKLSGPPFEKVAWDDALKLIADEMRKAAGAGKNNVYLSGRTSGSLSGLIDDFCSTTGVERLPEYEAFAHANLREAYNLLFGRREIPAYRIEDANFLLTIGADVIETFVSPVNYSVQLQRAKNKDTRFKWMHFEPHASLTGFKATERVTIKPGGEPYLLLFLLNYIILQNLQKNNIPSQLRDQLPQVSSAVIAEKSGLPVKALTGIAEDLGAAQNPLLICGGVSAMQSGGLETAVLAGLLQWATGMTGSVVDFSHAEDYSRVGTLNDAADFSTRLDNDEIGVAVVSKTDPLFRTLPGNMKFNERFRKAAFRVALVDVITENDLAGYAEMYDLILPVSHTLESWGDLQPRKGLINIMQPVLKEPLYSTRSEGDILLNLAAATQGKEAAVTYEQWLKRKWETMFAGTPVEAVLQNGYYRNDVPGVSVSLDISRTFRFLREAKIDRGIAAPVMYALPSIRTFDGRSKDLPLIPEIPDPVTTISYGNWVSISPEAAQELNLKEQTLVHKHRDEINVQAGDKTVKRPSMVQPGLPKDVYTMYRDQVDPNMISYDERSGEVNACITDISVSKAGSTGVLAIMAGSIEEGHRNIIPTGEEHHHGQEYLKGDETLYPDPYAKYQDYRWGISIDMESCIGCSACVAACYMENNIPCVGEKEHVKGREMSWIRVQPYYHDDGTMDSLVMLCQQCDFAPCENVCPVYATYHNEEGLNVMVYNRCVGTRYCHNNCPYKVRRFNWFDWTDEGAWQEPMTRMLNPDIWVRPKGVMEKCTFCIQRIRKAKDTAKDANRKVRDGEITPACAQTCPTNAITFGNLLDKESEVYRKSQSNRQFRVLETLGTSPGVHYLRKEEKA